LDKEQEIKEIKKKGKGAARSILKQLIFTLMLVILIPALLVFEMLGIYFRLSHMSPYLLKTSLLLAPRKVRFHVSFYKFPYTVFRLA